MVLESALVLPFFLCALTALLYLFVLTAEQADSYRRLSEKAQTLAVTIGQHAEGEPYITLYDPDLKRLPFSFGQKIAVQKVKTRAWVGYTGEAFSQTVGGPFVYVTPEKEVYHRSQECTHLKLTIQSILSLELSEERNVSGGRYVACEYCVGNASAYRTVYITDYGDCYHNRRTCQGLKRTVMAIPLSQVKGIPCCTKCAKR